MRKSKKSQPEVLTKAMDLTVERYTTLDFNVGLSLEQVENRHLQKLCNQTHVQRGKTIGRIIFDNLFTFFNILYVIITILLSIASSLSNMTYLPVIIPNIIISIVQEIKAKKMIDKLSLVSAPKATVVRAGETTEITTDEVVLDDILVLNSGDQIYTDAIIMSNHVEVNESLITGESDYVGKGPGDFLYSGSYIVSGSCFARAEHVGYENYIEKLASEARKHQKPKSELMRTLNYIIRIIAIIIVPLGALTFYQKLQSLGGIFNMPNYVEAIKTAAAVVIGMIPSGLYLLTTIALAVGVRKLGKNHTLVQELYCIEMLARVDTLCLDKTGTITDGTMKVLDCVEVKNTTDYTIREIVGSMMNAFPESNPTSDALVRYFDKNKVLSAVVTIPFSSKRKYSAVTFANPMNKEVVGTFLLGAPEFVLNDQYEKVKSKVERFAAQGCRVLVLGYATGSIRQEQPPKIVRPLALIVIQDHIREQAYATIEYFRNNGVDVKVISGDNPLTVSEIAARAGVRNAERFISLEGLTDEEVTEIAFDYTVFGRVSPLQKRVLVRALKAQKRIVAMTGDGVNDILALKEADCSIAMASGSEATRYVSHLVLMDSNFASMPKVVSEGRRVINNIQRTSSLFLVKTIFTVLLTIMYLVLSRVTTLGFGFPFQSAQLWLIEFFAIGFPATILAIQPNNEKVKGRFIANVMRRTLPGALTVVFFHAVMYILRLNNIFDWTQEVYSSIALIQTTWICILVLFQVSKPFNWLKGLVFGFILICSIVAVVFLGDMLLFGQPFLNIVSLDKTNYLFLFLLLVLAPQVMAAISKVLGKVPISE
ncbi:MAG: HAD-IC family P-type ATPase [Bacilli bacterium]